MCVEFDMQRPLELAVFVGVTSLTATRWTLGSEAQMNA